VQLRRRSYAAFAIAAAGVTVAVTPSSSAAARGPAPVPAAVVCPAAPGPSRVALAGNAGSSYSVSVPRFTFLVRTGDGWTVRTNTEASPDPRDQFVILADAGWSPAPPTLANLVLRVCGE
jgi:hypothetical protein